MCLNSSENHSHMSKFKPGKVMENSSSTISPPSGIEPLSYRKGTCSIPAGGPIVDDKLFSTLLAGTLPLRNFFCNS